MTAASNHLKTPLAPALNRAIAQRIQDAVQLTGKALPCSVVSRSGPLVTVKFEVTSGFTLPKVQVPLLMAEYVRLPIRAGAKGVVIPFDVRLGNITGTGGATPPGLDQPANLAALGFLPIGALSWPSIGSDDELVLYSTQNAVLTLADNGVHLTGANANLTAAGTVEGAHLRADDGASGTFLSQDGKTITVQHGIITSIV